MGEEGLALLGVAHLGETEDVEVPAREALDHYAQALALRNRLNGPKFIDNAVVLAGIGEAHVELRATEPAIGALERALGAAVRAEHGFRSRATPVALAEAERVRAWLASHG